MLSYEFFWKCCVHIRDSAKRGRFFPVFYLQPDALPAVWSVSQINTRTFIPWSWSWCELNRHDGKCDPVCNVMCGHAEHLLFQTKTTVKSSVSGLVHTMCENLMFCPFYNSSLRFQFVCRPQPEIRGNDVRVQQIMYGVSIGFADILNVNNTTVLKLRPKIKLIEVSCVKISLYAEFLLILSTMMYWCSGLL